MSFAHNRILVFGLDVLGLAVSLRYASWGYEVFCFDFDERKVKMMSRGLIAKHWPSLKEKWDLYQGNIVFISSLAQIEGSFDLFVLAQDTYQENKDSLQKNDFYDAVDFLAKYTQNQLRILIHSLVEPGTSEKVTKFLNRCDKSHISVIYQPFGVEGVNIVEEIFNPKKIIIGCLNDEDHFFMGMLFMPFNQLGVDMVYVTPIEAELIAFASLHYQNFKRAYAKEWALICDNFNVSLDSVLYGVDPTLQLGEQENNNYEAFYRKQLLKWLESCSYEAHLLDSMNQLDTRWIERIVRSCVLKRNENNKLTIIGLEAPLNSHNYIDANLYALINKLLEEDFEIWLYDENVLSQIENRLKEQRRIHFIRSIKDAIKEASIILINQKEIDLQLLNSVPKTCFIYDIFHHKILKDK